MLQNIAAVAFDIDGTLYPNYRFYLRVLPRVFSCPRLLLAFIKTRRKIRLMDASENFYDLQAALCAEELGLAKRNESVQEVKTLITEKIYSDWEKLFAGVKPYPHVRTCLNMFKAQGLKLAVLSDFPLGSKLIHLGLDGFWDAELCSERLGALKPHAVPFRSLTECLDLPPQQILYVGNSPAYDIAGAKNMGMGTALRGCRPGFSLNSDGAADFTFTDYRQLQKYVLR
jgi:putative hydrolase of the HAD superfamily